ncbi:MAG TPA: hypothetical protein VFB60_26585 [Ktedonobacteraceae bacterium]|nr:hypothetical protein [Ktedonobacteraceae bacterium]
MKRITRNIPPDRARDLLERVPRACIAFANDLGPQVQPVTFVSHENRYLVGLPEHVTPGPSPHQEIVLLIDEGISFFDLRALLLRGYILPTEAPPDAPPGRRWFEVLPLKTVAWDYGALREVHDAS